MQRNKIEVTHESFYLTTGFSWSPNEHRFLFRDATDMDVITVPDLKGRPKKYMRVSFKSGGYDDVPMGDLFRAHESEILKAVSDRIVSEK